MALVPVCSTQYHGNPRPITSYSTTVYDDAVTPIQYFHYITRAPLTSLVPAASIVTAGPALVVAGDVDGLWPNGSGVNIGITVEGGTNISTSIVNGTGQTIGPDSMATQIAAALNTIGAGDVQCGATGNQVGISALAGVTNLTITTWAVAP